MPFLLFGMPQGSAGPPQTKFYSAAFVVVVLSAPKSLHGYVVAMVIFRLWLLTSLAPDAPATTHDLSLSHLPLLVPHNSCCRPRNVLYARLLLPSCHGGSRDEARLSWLSPTDWSRCVGGPRRGVKAASRGDLQACVFVLMHFYASYQTRLCPQCHCCFFNQPHPRMAPYCCEPISYLQHWALHGCAQAQQHIAP